MWNNPWKTKKYLVMFNTFNTFSNFWESGCFWDVIITAFNYRGRIRLLKLFTYDFTPQVISIRYLFFFQGQISFLSTSFFCCLFSFFCPLFPCGYCHQVVINQFHMYMALAFLHALMLGILHASVTYMITDVLMAVN